MKQFIILLMAVSLMLCLNACGSPSMQASTELPLTVPDILNMEENVAKNIISSYGIIPNIQYQYDDLVTEGNVIRTEPDINSTIHKGDTVTIFISKGPSIVKPQNATIYWNNVHDDLWKDEWTASIRRENGVIYIDCEVEFGTNVRWKPDSYAGEGIASTDSSFVSSIPIKVTNIAYESQPSYFGTVQIGTVTINKFTIEIPADELGVNDPSRLYVRLDAEHKPLQNAYKYYETVVNVWFAINW